MRSSLIATLFFIQCLILVSLNVAADDSELDTNQQAALKQTQDLLRDSHQRQSFIDKDPHAKDLDDKINALVGSKQNKDDMYDLAAQIFAKITQDAHGDPKKMQELMNDAQKDPKAFYEKYFSDSQKAKVRDVANKIKSDQPNLGSGK